jgi:asparagine synthase (glutamine-hydrolysing)
MDKSWSNANAIQFHRGPDHQGEWLHDNVALAHQRLSIIDLNERSNQPFVKEGLVIVFNGEIYNYKEIRSRLEKECGAVFLTSGDTEVVLEAYRHWGADSLKFFIGMFSYCIYVMNERKLFLVRDHFGIKPLFYFHSGNQFSFSSELKTLLITPGFRREVNSFSLLTSLNYLWVSGNETMFKGCEKLKAGHFLEIQCNQIPLKLECKRYWEPTVNLKLKSEEEWVELLNKQLQASIDRHMVSDVPVSSFLSGGLDSSLISVLASRQIGQLSTFTIATRKKDKGIEKMPEDEKYAAWLAKKFNFDHKEILIEPTIVEDLPRVVRMLDEPIGDPAAINTYLICKCARERGVKVLLSGMGADEIFFGYRRQQATLYAARYHLVPKPIRQMIGWGAGKLPVKIGNKGIKSTRWIKRFLSFADLPIEQAYRRSYSYYDDDDYQDLLHADYQEEVTRLNRQHREIFFEKEGLDLENRMCFTDLHMFMLGLNLTYTDRASMAASVEVRVPFIDREMVNFAMSIPGKLKFRRGNGKYILKRAAERILPREIIYRPKASFGAPIRSWISNDLKEMINDLLSRETIDRRGILNYDFVKKLIDDDRAGRSDHAYQIYQLLTLELWFREFCDQ